MYGQGEGVCKHMCWDGRACGGSVPEETRIASILYVKMENFKKDQCLLPQQCLLQPRSAS
eukprot:767469-Pelagomonas_calceolata.AAC.2